MLVDRVQAIHRVCFDVEPSLADLESLGSPERWLVYRDLVRTRLVGVVEAALPRTKKAAGEQCWQQTITDWLSAGAPKTRYFRRVPNEMARFAVPLWRSREPFWLGDLASYEIALWTARHAPPDPKPIEDFRFDRPPIVGASVQLVRLRYPVHRAPTPLAAYAAEQTALCVYRNEEHRAVSRTLNPLAADLLESWQSGGETVAESVERTAAAHGVTIGPSFVDKLSSLIADFLERSIVLGGHDPHR